MTLVATGVEDKCHVKTFYVGPLVKCPSRFSEMLRASPIGGFIVGPGGLLAGPPSIRAGLQAGHLMLLFADASEAA